MISFRMIAAGVALLLLAGCKVELYSGLQEKEGNEMLAILLSEGIDASKTIGKGNSITLTVAEDQLPKAIEILSRHSYPKYQYATLNDVFPQGGLIQSPMAENARYTFAMSQDLAATIASIDGVLTAKVHLVLPDQESKNKVQKDGQKHVTKASVFIKHNHNVSLEPYIPQIKTMVANSVENLAYENIAVVIFPSMPGFTVSN